MENSEKLKTYRKAKKRVQEEQSFYTHLSVYIVINIAIIIVVLYFKDYIYEGYLIPNLVASPLLWGIFLTGHGLWTFRGKNGLEKQPKRSIFSKKWEERKIRELMDETDNF
ncbi:2TM domain-containing protein [Aquimarina sp. MMG016]|uniref:2TM domain-containing protein n=1 Tax=Aquimarina sp. MMG016 TaxID=2822690 RepID=UPI001B39FEFC|nr:2TM domain-containing protein [Aquimarina sp. MMG016]MBQ4822392.1 2TM domain-containing protein [Aquimarina sp. MMG016]